MNNIEHEICAGGWRCLCAGVMLQAVERLVGSRMYGPRASSPRRKIGEICRDGFNQKKAAIDWVSGGIGLITFEDCCESIGVDPERARRLIKAKVAAAEEC